MTTKQMSNHKPYLQFSRTETSLYLEAFVKHTRFMHLLVGLMFFGVFFSPRQLAVQPRRQCHPAEYASAPLGLHEADPRHPGAAKPQALTYRNVLLNTLPLNKKFACSFGASPCLSINFSELNTLQATFRLQVVSSPPPQLPMKHTEDMLPLFLGKVFILALSCLPGCIGNPRHVLIICATAGKAPGVISHRLLHCFAFAALPYFHTHRLTF